MARINISIPDELKEKMDKFSDVNWSKVAQDSFDVHVELIKLKGINMQAAGIERLRASKRSNEEHDRAEFFGLGKEWALHTAEYGELRQVVELTDAGVFEGEIDDIRCSVFAAMGIDAATQYIRDDALEFFGTNTPSLSKLRGFVEGATEVFRAV